MLTVDEYSAHIQGIVELDARTEADDILQAVVDEDRWLLHEAVVIESLFVEERIGILHHIHKQRKVRAAHNLHAQRIRLLLAQQPACLVDLHLVAVGGALPVRCLVHIEHCLRDTDISMSLLHGLAIEGTGHAFARRIVLRNPLQRLFHYTSCAVAVCHHLVELQSNRYHQYCRMHVVRAFWSRSRKPRVHISDVRQFELRDSVHVRNLQREHTFGIGHCSYRRSHKAHRHILKFLSAFLVTHHTRDSEFGLHCLNWLLCHGSKSGRISDDKKPEHGKISTGRFHSCTILIQLTRTPISFY